MDAIITIAERDFTQLMRKVADNEALGYRVKAYWLSGYWKVFNVQMVCGGERLERIEGLTGSAGPALEKL